jgi:hypothetical protein
VAVSKPAYLAFEHGANRAGAPGVSIPVVGGRTKSLELRLAKGGVIAGRIVNQFGEPLPSATVRVLELAVENGREVLRTPPQAVAGHPLAGGQDALADDLGRYRIYGLPPGRYFVGATPGFGPSALLARLVSDEDVRAVLTPAGRMVAGAEAPANRRPREAPRRFVYGPSFHPGVSDIGSAVAVDVAASEERAGIDIVMSYRSAVGVSGSVASSSGEPAAGGRLSFRPAGLYVTTRYAGLALANDMTLGADGSFEIEPMIAGDYDVLVRHGTDWTRTTWRIGDADLTGLRLALQSAATVTGRIRFGGGAPPPSSADVRLHLEPAADDDLGSAVDNVRPDDSGRFAFDGVVPGRYWLKATGLPPAWRLGSAIADGGDVLDTMLEVAPGASPPSLLITAVPGLATLVGTFTDSTGRPASEYFVVLFSEDARHWLAGSRRIHAARPDTDGRFRFADLPAGRYHLAAVPDLAAGDLVRARFLQELLPASIAIDVPASGRITQNIRVAGR